MEITGHSSGRKVEQRWFGGFGAATIVEVVVKFVGVLEELLGTRGQQV